MEEGMKLPSTNDEREKYGVGQNSKVPRNNPGSEAEMKNTHTTKNKQGQKATIHVLTSGRKVLWSTATVYEMVIH
jgi:hypothetical protein